MKNKRIVIIGGGTAGWITANLFAKRWNDQKIEVTLIESPDIPIIGVGEGSTPYIKNLFTTLDIAECEWMDKCNATFKNGIQFNNWSSTKGFEGYFHPFLSELDAQHIPEFEKLTQMRRQGFDVPCHPDEFFLMTKLTNQFKLPHSPKHFPFRNAYSYHFDSHLLGEFLRNNGIKLGVTHIQANITDVKLKECGEIAYVETDTSNQFDADLFVDCTGFKSLLMNKALNVPFVSYKNNLFNDSAVAVPTKVKNKAKPCTVSTALNAGWAWEIPLQNRVGNGYVYSSDYISSEEAEQELINKIGKENIIGPVRHLKMRVGRAEKVWFKNCLAIGLSQGFIEPLEATALHIVQKTVEDFITAYEQSNFSTTYQNEFNVNTNHDYERLRDYIVMHYLTNSRNDTQYWRDARSNITISNSLNSAIKCWYSGGDLNQHLDQQGINHFYTSASWHAMLAGVGCFPEINRAKNIDSEPANTLSIKTFIERCSVNYPTL
jgi:flavin-dependent dehydrogenase